MFVSMCDWRPYFTTSSVSSVHEQVLAKEKNITPLLSSEHVGFWQQAGNRHFPKESKEERFNVLLDALHARGGMPVRVLGAGHVGKSSENGRSRVKTPRRSSQ